MGRAHADGIEVPGSPGRLSYTQFEAHAGSKLHRPCEHTFTLAGKSLQVSTRATRNTCPWSSEVIVLAVFPVGPRHCRFAWGRFLHVPCCVNDDFPHLSCN